MTELLRQKVLVAEYMGAEVTQSYSQTKEQDGLLFYFKNDKDNKNTSPGMYKNMSSVAISYHSSWEWLMPVVVKLRSRKFLEVGESKYQLALQMALCSPTLEGVYAAVIEFLEWLKKSCNTF